MQAVAEIVLRQLICNAIQSDPTLVDAVCITAYCRSKVACKSGVVLDVSKTYYHILLLAILVRNHNGNDTCTEVGNPDFAAVLVGQCVQVSLLACKLHLEVGLVENRSLLL